MTQLSTVAAPLDDPFLWISPGRRQAAESLKGTAMDTHASIIEEMSQVMGKLALAYIESGKYVVGNCLHCDAYKVIERAKKLDDCMPVDEVIEAARH